MPILRYFKYADQIRRKLIDAQGLRELNYILTHIRVIARKDQAKLISDEQL